MFAQVQNIVYLYYVKDEEEQTQKPLKTTAK